MLPEENFPAEKYPSDLKPQDHYHDWVDAILKGRKACDDFTHGGPLTEAVLVGAMADRVAGEWLEWDRKLLQVHEQQRKPPRSSAAPIATAGRSRAWDERSVLRTRTLLS